MRLAGPHAPFERPEQAGLKPARGMSRRSLITDTFARGKEKVTGCPLEALFCSQQNRPWRRGIGRRCEPAKLACRLARLSLLAR